MTDRQPTLGLTDTSPINNVEEYQFEPIKGYPMLQWHGKRPFRSTRYYPAQRKEIHGPEVDGWRSKIYWGDNLQVMSHLLKEFRGQIKLIYIDPPFDSKAEYKKKVSFGNHSLTNDPNVFEEKQYTDIWTNDEYLQFMFERLVIMRELLSLDGSIVVHCDWRKNHHLRCILDEIFGPVQLRNHIVWRRIYAHNDPSQFGHNIDHLLYYVKSEASPFSVQYIPYTQDYISKFFTHVDRTSGRRYRLVTMRSPNPRPNLTYDYKGYKPHPNGWAVSRQVMEELDKNGYLEFPSNPEGRINRKYYLDEMPGSPAQELWTDLRPISAQSKEREGYPTQKPESLVERIIRASSNPGDLVFDCFMGSGTTQAVAMKLGRRFIGADINLGAVQITTKRLIQIASEIEAKQAEAGKAAQQVLPLGGNETEDEAGEQEPTTFYTGFEVYNVNNYDIFRNPVEAKELLIQALEVQPAAPGSIFDGVKDGYMVKVMPVNRIATQADLNELLGNLDYRVLERRYADKPNQPVERIMLVCMGHDPDLRAHLERELAPWKLDVEVVDILRDRSDLEFKREAEASVVIRDGELIVEAFYPMNLLQKLSLEAEAVEDWRELVESIMVDWNYDGAVLTPAVVDIPEKKELVVGRYTVPGDAGTIRVKITDLLSESWEGIVA